MNAPTPYISPPAPPVSPPGKPHIKVYSEMVQGSGEWLQARCGLLTASEMKLVVTPTMKAASNDKERAHLFELLAQRITGYVEPQYVSDDMLRGHEDEIEARILYDEHFAKTEQVGFITNDCWGFTIGYSPDALTLDGGQIECKSRRQKYQVQTIIECTAEQTIPAEFMAQIQTGLLVTEREWCDFISYSGGLPMAVVRVYPDAAVQDAIIEAAGAFEQRIADRLEQFEAALKSDARLIPTERKIEQEMFV